jgi:hypothetical protein
MADGFVPPQAVRSNAKRGLELRKKHGRGGTEVGVARARDLSNGKALSLDTLKRMNSYFARHEVDKKGEGWGVDSAGYIAWLLWGGDAGRSWAKSITNKEDTKEKSTVNDLTTAYFEIIKSDKRDDGTLMVYGKATDDSLDIDQQICDPLWLDRAMPEWFKSGGNIREQHSSIAAGVAKEYEKKADGHYIHALVVDPISVKKVDNGVLKGFSIGIKSPRVVRDQKAANGRIIDGQIVEVSLVDRPANPNCQLVLAKSVEGETGMWKTEELIEKEQSRDDRGRFGSSSSSDSADSPRDPSVDEDQTDSADSPRDPSAEISPAASARMEDHADSARNLSQELSNNPKDDPTRDVAKKDVDKAREHIEAASKTENPAEAKAELGKAKTQLDRAVESLEDQNYHDEAEAAFNLSRDITNTVVRLKLGKSASIALQLSEIADDSEKRAILMKNAQELIELSKSIAPADIVKFDQKLYDDARRALAQLIVVEANEMDAGSNEEMSIAHLLSAVHHLLAWYGGEVAEGEVMDQETEDIELAAKPEEEDKAKKKELKPAKDETKADYMKRCKEAGMDDETIKSMCDKYMSEDADMEKSTESHKCLECGCGVPQDAHGRDDVSTADMITPDQAPKSAEPTEEVKELTDQELPAEEETVSEGSNLTEEVEAIVEKAIKSATESLKSEIAQLANAKEAAVNKAVGLESELAVAKSLAVAGGPKRTIKPVDHSTNDLLVKAATYKAKADASTDPDLMKGYKLLAEQYLAEADTITKSN